ncbi:hypothetical protein [Salidesulfovibrio onnuriiensis]|uniref:hypothetical protein n=1 Tax=Salidesulfovibrio onnuriiensis TaxID=2583823 RepID=UPI001C9C3085|nr:hypothetical protein [Salidesulfovibrio onnuriiensis]
MRRNTLIACMILCCLTLFALAGCKSKPVMNVHDALVPQSSGSHLTMQQVEKTILEAGAGRGWVMQVKQPGVILGEITVRGKHHATIKITYNEDNYNIDYVNSRNLDYKNGKIHRSYNNWITYLDQDIRSKLSVAQYN